MLKFRQKRAWNCTCFKQAGCLIPVSYTHLSGHTLTIGKEMPDPGAARLTALEMSLNQTPGGFTLVSSDSADYPYILCGRRLLRSQDMSLKKLGTVVAVSYTHLDVYKRQGCTMRISCGFRISHSARFCLYKSGILLEPERHSAGKSCKL